MVSTLDKKTIIVPGEGYMWNTVSKNTLLSKGVGVIIKNVTYTPGTGSEPILKNVSFYAKPGQLTGIIGISGSGKTSLLNIITNRIVSKTKVEGSIYLVTLNTSENQCDEKIQTDQLHQKKNKVLCHSVPRINYVGAKDIFTPGCTVKDTLLYAADLKLYHVSRKERIIIVNQLLQLLNLETVQDKYVGGTLFSSLSISESKRLSLGIEIMNYPEIIILDEPTSGLDGYLSFSIIQKLKHLAITNQQTMIISIHQPRQNIFYLFDNVLFLVKGEVVYFGSPYHLVSYIHTNYNILCSNCCNPATFALDIFLNPCNNTWNYNTSHCDHEMVGSMDSIKTNLDQTMTSKVYEANRLNPQSTEDIIDMIECHKIDDMSHFPNITKWEILPYNEITMARQPMTYKEWISQTIVLCQRQINSRLHDPYNLMMIIIVCIIQGVLLGSIFYNFTDHVKEIEPTDVIHLIKGFIPHQHSLLDSTINSIAYKKEYWEQLIHCGRNHSEVYPIEDIVSDTELFYFTTFVFKTLKESDIFKKLHYPSMQQLHRQTLLFNNTMTTPTLINKTSDIKIQSNTILFSIYMFSWEKIKELLEYLQLFDFLFFHQMLKTLKKCFVNSPSYFLVSCTLSVKRMVLNILQPFENITTTQYSPRLLQYVDVNGISTNIFTLSELNKETIQQLSDTLGLTTVMEKHIGRGPLQLYDILYKVFQYIQTCQEPVCLQILQLTKKNVTLLNTMYLFCLNSYITIGTMFNLSGVFFFITLFLGFSAYDILLTFPRDRALFNKETAGGLYAPSTYYIARQLSDLPFQLIPAGLLSFIVYFIIGLQPANTNFFEHLAIFMLISLLICYAAYGFGYMISALSSRLEIAILLAPFFLIIWLTIAGFFLRDSDLPSWILWFKYLSFYRWGFFAHVSFYFQPNKFFGNLPNEINLALCGITDSRVWFSCAMIFCCGILYRFLGFIFLKYCHRTIGLEL